ncbi:type VI secretion protein IcmF/TssM N-terminal domain-containing protein, partial [Staphylococcus aureus]
LLARLSERMLERVQQETDLQRRRLIYGFPQQVAALRDVAVEFLGEIFRPSRLEARPLLRGVYLTSGTQDGTSIDRLMGAMAASFG